MKVKAVRLENIRSHANSTVEFAAGFNCLVGGLGCGKSSVLYAIDFALFGEPLGRSYDYLLREGTDSGKVSVQFVDGGRTYTIWRGLRRQEKGISQDMEQLKLFDGEKLIASAKGEAVAEQLKAITGFDRDLFREVVWIRQEHLKELLDIAPRERQRRLDQLFGLSDYETAWTNTSGVQKEYTVEKQTLERDSDVMGMGRLQTNYRKLTEESTLNELELGELQKKLAQAESSFKEASSRLQSLEDLRKKTEDLRRQEVQLQTSLTNAQEMSKRLSEEIARKKVLVDDLAKRIESMEKQEKSYRSKLSESGLKPDQTIEDLKTYLRLLEEQRRGIAGEQEAFRQQNQISQKRIQTLRTENNCPLCLQTLTGNYKISLLENLRKENVEREARLVELQKNLDELEELSNNVNLIVSTLQSLIPQMDERKRRLSEEHTSLEELAEESEEKQLQQKIIQDQLNAVRVEVERFDVSNLESARILRDETYMKYSDLKHEMQSAESRKRDIVLRMDELKERLGNAEQKVTRIKRVNDILGILDGIRGAYRGIQPKLRSEFVALLQRTVQRFLDNLTGEAGPGLIVEIDEDYTPLVRSEEGHERSILNLSGGERTLLAFAYRLGLGQLIMQSRTGHGLYMLFLDEPTESLGREDGSVDRLAEAISRLKAIEQIIAVTHSEAFAEKAEHVIRVEKEANVSRISAER